MKLKAKLATTCAAFCLVLCLTIVSVWAVATGSNVPMGGTVGFTADDVEATISGSITGISGTQNLATLNLDAETENVEDVDGYSTWQGWTLNFADKFEDIVLTITIKNENSKRPIEVIFTDNSSQLDNIAVSLAGGNADGSASYTSGAEITIQPEQSITFKVTVHIQDANDSASGNLAFNLALKNVESIA